jgi:hypothetical protein
MEKELIGRKDGSSQCMIARGNPKNGFVYTGPFKNSYLAMAYAGEMFPDENAWIIDLFKPEKLAKLSSKAPDSMLPITPYIQKGFGEEDPYLKGITKRKPFIYD